MALKLIGIATEYDMPLAPSLIGDLWRFRTARTMLPILIWCAKHRRTISYSHLDAEIVRRGLGAHTHAAAYGRAAGLVGDALYELEEELGLELPPLNALVVKKYSRRPGSGCNAYLDQFVHSRTFAQLNDDGQWAVLEQAWDKIYNCRNWDAVLDYLEMEALAGAVPSEYEDDHEQVIIPETGGFSGGESEHHRRLKEYVLRHPNLVIESNARDWEGGVEVMLPSGDCADVMFHNGPSMLAVEVKSFISSEADLSRGIFQCVKYRAVGIAWQRALLEVPDASAVLVVQQDLPLELAILAERLDVRVVVVPTELTAAMDDESLVLLSA
ncbi:MULTISPECIES: hypothetical protein [Pseudomonas]|uniref:Uncharacterized protein n=1 Tax=Pseudomonas putida TaxID=303 RepID=A0A7V8J2A0_PSEPU|nr:MULTISPECIES: hypothetical protein [Pseudomonas]KAF0252167.1 hypothetical protein GN299_24580 [Pseudomonas putida]MDD1983674.1 hypothetical protein [Pseudomonas asiatica]